MKLIYVILNSLHALVSSVSNLCFKFCIKIRSKSILLLALCALGVFSKSVADTERIKLILIGTADSNQIIQTTAKDINHIFDQKINPYEGLDVLSLMANMESGIEQQAEVFVLPHSIIMQSSNSILREYLQKLNMDKSILFIAPSVNSNRNIFTGWKSHSFKDLVKGKAKSKNSLINAKLNKLSKTLIDVYKDLDAKSLDRLQIFVYQKPDENPNLESQKH